MYIAMGKTRQDQTLISEKEDLVHVLMLFANGTDPCLSTDYSTNVSSQNAVEEPLYVSFYTANMCKY